jgi:hypothetical protein
MPTNLDNIDVSKAGQKWVISLDTQTDGGPWVPRTITIPDDLDSLTPGQVQELLVEVAKLLDHYLALW